MKHERAKEKCNNLRSIRTTTMCEGQRGGQLPTGKARGLVLCTICNTKNVGVWGEVIMHDL